MCGGNQARGILNVLRRVGSIAVAGATTAGASAGASAADAGVVVRTVRSIAVVLVGGAAVALLVSSANDSG